MLKFGIIVVISHIVLNGLLAQVVGNQYPSWLLQLGVRAVPQEALPRRQIIDHKSTQSCPEANQNIIEDISGKEPVCDMHELLRNSLLSLVELGNGFYYFGTYFKANFFKAMQFCKDHGMNLVSIETNDENTRIIKFLDSMVIKIDHWWTSGSDLGEERNYVWLSTGKSFNFTYWGTNQPDNAGNSENCLEVAKDAVKPYLWNDNTCSKTFNFICEV